MCGFCNVCLRLCVCVCVFMDFLIVCVCVCMFASSNVFGGVLCGCVYVWVL